MVKYIHRDLGQCMTYSPRGLGQFGEIKAQEAGSILEDIAKASWTNMVIFSPKELGQYYEI